MSTNPFLTPSQPIPIQVGLRRPDINIFRRMATIDSNPIGALHEALRAAKLDFDAVCTHQCADQLPDGCWLYQIHMLVAGISYAGKGEANSKQSAKHLAFRDIYEQLSPILRNIRDKIRVNMASVEDTNIAKSLGFQMINEHLSIAIKLSKHFDAPVYVHVIGNIEAPMLSVEIEDRTIYYQHYKEEYYVLSKAAQHFSACKARAISDLYYTQPKTCRTDDGLKVYVHYDTVANMMKAETPIEPVAQVGVQDNPGTQTIPHLPNPQPTAVTPAMAVQDPALVSALEPLLPHDLLNPIGPPNMLGVGGVTFDIKDLIYSQYMDCDVQYQYTDDTPQGQVIFQIPYDPTSQYVNPYIRQWLNIHPRYTGALNFRFTIVGNTTFSGLIGFAWYPRQINANVVKVSEMMKYSYTTMGINEPSNRIFTLFDARQTQFWRDTADDPKLNPRPVIVCFIYMTAVSPLKEGITIRIRVASKLSDGSDGPAFVAAEPTIPSTTPGIGVPAPTGLNTSYNEVLTGMPLVPIIARPITFGVPLYMTVDGRCYKPYVNVTETGDYIIDTANTWLIQPSHTQSSNVIGAWSLDKSNDDPPIYYYKGAYVADFSKAQNLLMTSDSSPDFIPPVVADLYNLWSPLVAPGLTRPIEKVVEIVNKYVTVYQYAKFLNPTIGTDFKNAWFWKRGSNNVKIGINFSSVQVWILYTAGGPVTIAYLNWPAISGDLNSDSYIPALSMKGILQSNLINLTQYESITPSTSWSPETMPTGWRNISITADLPFVVSAGSPGVNGTYQSYNHPSIQSIFHALAIKAGPTQCLQLTMADLDSGNDLCFIRYYQDRLVAVVNFGNTDPNVPDYMSLVRPTTRVYVAHIDIVERSNSFPISDINNFASNVASDRIRYVKSKLNLQKKIYDALPDGAIIPNSDPSKSRGNWHHQVFPLGSRRDAIAGPKAEKERESFQKNYYYSAKKDFAAGHTRKI